MDRRSRSSGAGAGGKAGSELTVFKPAGAAAGATASTSQRNPFTVPTDAEIFQFHLAADDATSAALGTGVRSCRCGVHIGALNPRSRYKRCMRERARVRVRG